MKHSLQFHVRKADSKDFKDLLRLNKALFDFEDQFNQTYNLEWTYSEVGQKYFRSRLEDTNAIVYVAEIENKVIGYILGYVQNFAYSSLNPMCDVENMFIEEEYRHSGVGKKLMDLLKKTAKEKGVKKITLWAFKNNDKAIAYYHAMGFADERLHLEFIL